MDDLTKEGTNQARLCKCGKPAHPCYANRCEDCWANHASTIHGQNKLGMIATFKVIPIHGKPIRGES